MPVPTPSTIGQDSSIVRDSIQEIIDLFKQNLANPEYVKHANKAFVINKNATEGSLVFIIENRGQINDAEITAFQDGWVGAGWTTAICKNNKQSPNESIGVLTWTFILTYIP